MFKCVHVKLMCVYIIKYAYMYICTRVFVYLNITVNLLRISILVNEIADKCGHAQARRAVGSAVQGVVVLVDAGKLHEVHPLGEQ